MDAKDPDVLQGEVPTLVPEGSVIIIRISVRGERANFTGLVREAVSKPNFGSKYAFESSRRDLHNALESNPPMKRNG